MMLRVKDASSRRDVSGDIVDAVFSISCRCLPVDHAYALSRQIQEALPWFAEEPGAGLHLIYGAASASGWMRPQEPDALLQLSQREKLVLRLPARRLVDAAALLGRTLEVAGWPLHVEQIAMRPLSRTTTLFSRCVMFAAGGDESEFMAAATGELGALGITRARTVCGLVTPLATPSRVHRTRSLMVADLTPEQSLTLQRHGLGAGRTLGCGVFIPHKGIADVRSRQDSQ